MDWEGAVELGTRKVKFSVPRSDDVEWRVAQANRVVLGFIFERFCIAPDYRIIVCPDEQLPHAYGSTSKERDSLFRAPYYVIRTRVVDIEYIIAHEVTRHVLPDLVGKGEDIGHLLKEYEPLEKELKARMKTL